MKRILTAVLLIPFVVLVVIKAPLWLVAALVGVITLIALHEYLALGQAMQLAPLHKTTLAIAVLWFGALTWAMTLASLSMFSPTYTIALLGALLLLLLFPVMLMIALHLPTEKAFLSGIFSVSGLAFITWPMSLLVAIRLTRNLNVLMFLLLVVWAGDIVALYTGRMLGRNKLAPEISPKKTWEGAIGSVVGSVLVGVAFIHFSDGSAVAPRPLLPWCLIALAVNIAAQFGDLAESALKRAAGVKDSGSLLPGHGGMLDRIDALLFAAPVMWLSVVVLDIMNIGPHY